MNNNFSIQKVSSVSPADDDSPYQMLSETDSVNGARFRPWVDSLSAMVLSTESIRSSDKLSELMDFVDEVVDELQSWESPYRRAAEICQRVIGEERFETDDKALAIVAGFYSLKLQGYEAGRSPVDHWRINRLLNAGSATLDFLLDDAQFRPLSLETLFYRLLNVALKRGHLSSRGVVIEITSSIGWDNTDRGPRREIAPDNISSDPGNIIIEWLLDELSTRGLTSLMPEVAIEENATGREYVIGDAIGDWMRRLPPDEGRFVAGSLFSPAYLGGWSRPVDERMLDAFTVAREMTGDFVPQEEKIDVYAGYLRKIDELRRIPDQLSPSLQVSNSSFSTLGRFYLILHPLRRASEGNEGYITFEIGFEFEEPQPDVASWSSAEQQVLIQSLADVVEEEDDRCFDRFAQVLDGVVDRFNHAPAMVWKKSGHSAKERSPLWAELSQGIDELSKALETKNIEDLANNFQRWTVSCVESPRE